MYIVGLTGGIGSGKTAVSNGFAELGITVIDADVVAREVVEPGTDALRKIAEHFGQDILQADGSLNRPALRQRIFADSDAKHWLEALLHPLIGAETWRQLETAQSPYVIYVSPLLIESGQHEWCQRVLVVDVPTALQLERTMSRDNNQRELVESIMASQASREQRLAVADDVIDNSEGLETLKQKVAELHRQYLEYATQTA